jgi:peptidoglycan/LPS O-acetylase OafA/YrhL
VVLAHVRLVFSHLLPGHPPANLLQYGSLAVYIFFTLSGFVLSLKFLREPGAHSLTVASIGRYFRLLIPILATNLIALALMQGGLIYAPEAAALGTPDPWLANMYAFTPSLPPFLWFSFYAEPSYNSSLWTMPPEMCGSLLLFAMLAILARFPAARLRLPALLAVALLMLRPQLASFMLGHLLAVLHHRRGEKLVNWKYAELLWLPLFVLPLATTSFGLPGDNPNLALRAFCVTAAITFSPLLRWLFSARLSRAMGALSFPLYLIHMPVIASLSSYALLRMNDAGVGIAMAEYIYAALTLAASLACAALLLPVERFSIYASHRLSSFNAAPSRPTGSAH